MAKIENNGFKVELKIKAIELINGSLQLPVGQNAAITSFNYNINIESRADAANKLVFVIVHVEIKNDDQSYVLGALSVSCIFEIVNFEEVIKTEPDGKLNIPQPLIDTLNSISISTTRGIMFSTFKGTFLHNAILPVIEPKEFQVAL
jgi:hypothetical protein